MLFGRVLNPYHFPTLTTRHVSGVIGPLLWYALRQYVRAGRDQQAMAERIDASGETAGGPVTNRVYTKSRCLLPIEERAPGAAEMWVNGGDTRMGIHRPGCKTAAARDSQ